MHHHYLNQYTINNGGNGVSFGFGTVGGSLLLEGVVVDFSQIYLRPDAHGDEFLEEEFAGIGHFDLVDTCLFAAVAALAVLEEATMLADQDSGVVAGEEQSLEEEVAGSEAQQAVPLHFSQTQSSLLAPPLSWLPRQHSHLPCRSRVDLVGHHVLQPLVEDGPAENVAVQVLPRCARNQRVLPRVGKPVVGEYLAKVLDLIAGEGSPRVQASLEAAGLAADQFEQLSDGHAGGVAVGIHDEVGPPAGF